MPKPVAGQAFGCNDTSKPVKYTEEQLSRLLDCLNSAEKFNLKNIVWDALPYMLRTEFNYSKWGYIPE